MVLYVLRFIIIFTLCVYFWLNTLSYTMGNILFCNICFIFRRSILQFLILYNFHLVRKETCLDNVLCSAERHELLLYHVLWACQRLCWAPYGRRCPAKKLNTNTTNVQYVLKVVNCDDAWLKYFWCIFRNYQSVTNCSQLNVKWFGIMLWNVSE